MITSSTGTNRLPRHRAIWLIVALFLLTRFIFFSLEANDFLFRLPAQDDAPTYLDLASVFSGQQTYATVNRSPFTRVPIYPSVIALLPVSHPTGRLITLFFLQQLVQLGIILLVYFYLQRNYPCPLAIVATAWLILFYDFAMYGFLVRPETFFSALVLSACLLFLRAVATTSHLYYSLSACLFALSALTRPIAILVIIPYLIMTIYFSRLHQQSWRAVTTLICLVLISFTLPLAPWFYRNYSLSGRLVLQQDTGNLIHATVPGGHWGSVDIHQLIDTSSLTELEVDRAVTAIALKRIINHPSVWFKNSLANFSWRLWSMGFADTYLRYLGHASANLGGYHDPSSPPLWQRLVSAWHIFSPRWSINPVYHFYFILNNWLGLVITFLPLLGLVLLPYFTTPNKILFVFLLYFWLFTAFFAFSGSRYMMPILPLLWLIVPGYRDAADKLLKPSSPP